MTDIHKLYKYMLSIREKILKLYLFELYDKYRYIYSFNNKNFLDDEIISIIDPHYNLVIEKLNLILCKLSKIQIKQIGGSNIDYNKNQYIEQIKNLQQKIFILANNNNFLTQQLQQCQINMKLLANDRANMADKLLFFDKSLDTITQAISNNISNGEQRINMLSSFIKSQKAVTGVKNVPINISVTAESKPGK